MAFELIETDDGWVVVDSADPPGALTLFEGDGAYDRAVTYVEWVNAAMEGGTPLLSWHERYAADASLRIFVDCWIASAVIGLDTALYNAEHYQVAAQAQADKVFALERQIRQMEREKGLPVTTKARVRNKRPY